MNAVFASCIFASLCSADSSRQLNALIRSNGGSIHNDNNYTTNPTHFITDYGEQPSIIPRRYLNHRFKGNLLKAGLVSIEWIHTSISTQILQPVTSIFDNSQSRLIPCPCRHICQGSSDHSVDSRHRRRHEDNISIHSNCNPQCQQSLKIIYNNRNNVAASVTDSNNPIAIISPAPDPVRFPCRHTCPRTGSGSVSQDHTVTHRKRLLSHERRKRIHPYCSIQCPQHFLLIQSNDNSSSNNNNNDTAAADSDSDSDSQPVINDHQIQSNNSIFSSSLFVSFDFGIGSASALSTRLRRYGITLLTANYHTNQSLINTVKYIITPTGHRPDRSNITTSALRSLHSRLMESQQMIAIVTEEWIISSLTGGSPLPIELYLADSNNNQSTAVAAMNPNNIFNGLSFSTIGYTNPSYLTAQYGIHIQQSDSNNTIDYIVSHGIQYEHRLPGIRCLKLKYNNIPIITENWLQSCNNAGRILDSTVLFYIKGEFERDNNAIASENIIEDDQPGAGAGTGTGENS